MAFEFKWRGCIDDKWRVEPVFPQNVRTSVRSPNQRRHLNSKATVLTNSQDHRHLIGDSDTGSVDQIWAPIVVALFGNAVAIVIVLLSNHQAVQREEARQDREDARLKLLRHDARVQRAGDDQRRVIELRKDYYIDLYREFRKTSLAVHNAGYEIGPKLEFGWNLPMYEALIRLRVFASDAAYQAASEANTRLWRWGDSHEGGFESDLEIAYDEALESYLRAVRHDLGIAIDEDRLNVDNLVH